MRLLKAKVLFLSVALLFGMSSTVSALERKSRTAFYLDTDFGSLAWLHQADSEVEAAIQDWVRHIRPEETACIPELRDTYWLQLNHRDPVRANELDAFVVSILYFDPQSPNVELQLYRNRGWYSVEADQAPTRELREFIAAPGDLPDIDTDQFIRLNSGSVNDDRRRMLTLSGLIGLGEFHASLDPTLETLSWQRRAQFSEQIERFRSEELFRVSARLFRFTVTGKRNSDAILDIELRRHGASRVVILVQSLSAAVREGLTQHTISFGSRCR